MMDGCSIRECLHGYTTDALAAMCETWQLVAASKSSQIKALERVLEDPLHLTNAVRRLSEPAQRLLTLMAERAETAAADALDVRALYGVKDPIPVLHEVARLGLVLAVPHKRLGAFSLNHFRHEWHPSEDTPRFFVSRGVMNALPDPPPLGVVLPTVPEPDGQDSKGPNDRGTALLLETLRIVEVVRPRITANGELHKADASRAHKLARESNLPKEALDLTLVAARQLGCVEEKEGRLETTAKADQWSQMPRAERVRMLFQAYLNAQDLPDLELFFPQLFDSLNEHLPRGWMRRTYHRRLVAKILAEQEEGRWHSVEALVEKVRTLDSDILFLDSRWRAIKSNAQDAGAVWKNRCWMNHEHRLFDWAIRVLLHDLGVVEVVGDAFRVTPVGRYALGTGGAPIDLGDVSRKVLVVQPNFEVSTNVLPTCAGNSTCSASAIQAARSAPTG